MTWQNILEISNALVVPAFAYIIVLERRITRLQTQIEFLIKTCGGNHGSKAQD